MASGLYPSWCWTKAFQYFQWWHFLHILFILKPIFQLPTDQRYSPNAGPTFRMVNGVWAGFNIAIFYINGQSALQFAFHSYTHVHRWPCPLRRTWGWVTNPSTSTATHEEDTNMEDKSWLPVYTGETLVRGLIRGHSDIFFCCLSPAQQICLFINQYTLHKGNFCNFQPSLQGKQNNPDVTSYLPSDQNIPFWLFIHMSSFSFNMVGKRQRDGRI